MRSKIFAVISVLVLASMLLAACQPAAPETVVETVVVEKEGQTIVVTATPAAAPEDKKSINLSFGTGGDVPTLDPALATDTSSIQVLWETMMGLTRQDEVTNEVQPALATDWDISEDGTVYTFHLRDDISWVKYDAVSDSVVQVMDCQETPAPRMVTANDIYYGILRTLNPETASDYAYVLAFAVEGAADYNNGVTDDPSTVGVEVIDDYTVEITFVEPAAYNAAIAGMWVAYPQPSWLIDGDDCTEGQGDRWTETGFNQGYGPYALKEWVHDSFITVVKNPFWPADMASAPQGKIEEITWHMLDETAQFAEYETGNMDVAVVPLADMDRVKADPVLSTELVISPNLCTYYYGFNTKAPVVDDVRVRRALSMAIDRQALIDNVTKGEQIPAQWFSRPGLAGAPTLDDHPDLGIKTDVEGAKAELQSYLDEKGVTADSLDLTLMFNTSSGHQKIAEAIQQMWKDSLGVNVKLVNQEWAVFLDTIRSAETPQIYRYGWCPDYADANNFIREVMGVNGSGNPDNDSDGVPDGGINMLNEDFEAKIREAARELDPAKRVELYAEAEEILVNQEAAIAPIYWYTRVTVTKPYVTRTFGSAGQESVDKWDIDMAAQGE